jgi:hypothetical protein
MVSFKAVVSRDDVTTIRNYIIHRANEGKTATTPKSAPLAKLHQVRR